ncbi:MAG: CrcB family protein [Chloroflexota bacterium]
MFLGAHTTFSTLSFESLALIQEQAYLAAAANLLANVLLGVAAVALGVILGRIF